MGFEFGFIGCGNMGSALAIAASKKLSGKQIILSNRTVSKAQKLAEKIGAEIGNNIEVAEKSHYIFLGVKPQMMAEALSSVSSALKTRNDRFILVTMAAGLTITKIKELSGGDYPVIRIMPNTPSAIGEGVIQYACDDKITEEEKAYFISTMSNAGFIDELPEDLIDAGSAVSGCGPAFVDIFIEALADGGVQIGLPRSKALTYAAQMVAGSAKLMLESGKHPAQLKDEVCSPGGSTIMGVHALENGGFRSSVMNAVVEAFEKNRKLGK